MKCASIVIIAAFIWLAAVLSGTWAMMVYANRPGAAGDAPANWPAGSRLPRPAGRPTLVIFLHPHCACSRASIGELALVMARGVGRVDARAVFIEPAEVAAGWAEGELWRAAAAIPGVVVERDAGGREAKLFRTATSGDTLLYRADGQLAFHGGITLARGHAGANPGRRVLEGLLSGAEAPLAAIPVFGCGLFAGPQRGKPWIR